MRLVLFFTRGMRLQDWVDTGLLEREIAIYRRLIARNVEVTFITYGTRADLSLAAAVDGINIRCNSWNLSDSAYRRFLPILHASALARADVIKTNQIGGSDVACNAARFWRKPFVVRCGYLLSDYLAWQDGPEAVSTLQAIRNEDEIVQNACATIVSSEGAATELRRRASVAPQRLEIIPNYVDTQLFRPMASYAADVDVLFVGRLAEQKNIVALLQAVESAGCSLRIIGSGPLRNEIEAFRSRMGGRLEILEPVPHMQLAEMYNRCRIFVLPSHWEGHPKTLIEAMACGRAVVVSDIPAMREVVRDGQTGCIASLDPASLLAQIRRLLVDDALRSRLGIAARAFVEENYSLDQIADREYSVISTAAGR